MDRLLSMRAFERVAEEGGFVAAARALDISAPVVTRLIAELESHLGTRLLQRTTRHVALTEAGEAYLSRVRHILQEVEEADAIASANTRDLAGRLRLQTQPVLSSYVIAPLLCGFREQYPNIQVDIEVGAHGAPTIEDFDITLLGSDASLNAEVIVRKVIESEIILVASPAYLHRHGLPQTPQDLSLHHCLRLKRPDSRLQPWRVWCHQRPEESVEVNVTPILMANHTDTLLRVALDGAGITSVSFDIVAPYLMRGELVRVLNPWIVGRMGMYAALPSRKFIPQRSRVFLNYLIQHTQRQNSRAMKALPELRQ